MYERIARPDLFSYPSDRGGCWRTGIVLVHGQHIPAWVPSWAGGFPSRPELLEMVLPVQGAKQSCMAPSGRGRGAGSRAGAVGAGDRGRRCRGPAHGGTLWPTGDPAGSSSGVQGREASCRTALPTTYRKRARNAGGGMWIRPRRVAARIPPAFVTKVLPVVP